MKKVIFLLTLLSVWFTTGCNNHSDPTPTATSAQSFSATLSSNSIRLALQPILNNLNSFFSVMPQNTRSSIIVSDTLKQYATGAALYQLIPSTTIDEFKSQFSNAASVGSNMAIAQSGSLKIGLCVVSENSSSIITRIVAEPNGNALVAVSYISDSINGNSTFAFSSNSTGEVSGRTFSGQQTNVTYETNTGYSGYVSGNGQTINYYSTETGTSVSVDIQTGQTSTGSGTNPVSGSGTGTVNTVSSWATVYGSSRSLSVSEPYSFSAVNTNYTADVTLSFSGSSVSSASPEDYSAYATFADGVLTINEAGTYELSGTLNGHIYIPNKISNGVTLVLNGLTVNGQTSGAIYSPAKTPLTIILPSGKTNVLNDCGKAYAMIDEDQYATVQNKELIAIAGSGSLSVNANGTYVKDTSTKYANGIQAKGNTGIVAIRSGNINVYSKGGNAIKAKVGIAIDGGNIMAKADSSGTGEALTSEDYIYIKDGILNLTAGDSTNGGDAIKADNDWEDDWADASYPSALPTTPLGRVYITGGTINATAYGDGIQAASDLEICGGNITVRTTNSAFETNDESSKGIKSGYSTENPNGSSNVIEYGGALRIYGGTITINSYDHGISSKGTLDIDYNAGINITVINPYVRGDETYGGKGLKSVKAMTIGANGDPKTVIFNSTEGIECKDTLTIKGGTTYVNSVDDGINAGFAKILYNGSSYTKDNNNSSYGYTHKVVLAGGYNYIRSGGDGIDSNGNMSGAVTISGGVTVVNCSGSADACMDADEQGASIVYTGGIFVGCGGDMAPSYPSNNAVVIGAQNLSQGTLVNISSTSGKVMTFAPQVSTNSVLYVGPLTSGTSYTVYTGGSDSGTAIEGYYSDGSYTSGTSYGSFTYSGTSATVNYSGQGGMGGQPGQGGQPPSGQPGQLPSGQGGQPPSMK